jgi:hypothetical protein
MYDKFVLYFPFNRSLDTIKKLPTKYKYVLLVNCACGYTCPGTFHWFAGCDERGAELVIGPPCQSSKPEQMILIPPNNLNLFDPYVHGYKLQGREHILETIKRDIDTYIPRKLINDKTKFEKYKFHYYEIYCDDILPIGEEVYFNMATGNSPFLELNEKK